MIDYFIIITCWADWVVYSQAVCHMPTSSKDSALFLPRPGEKNDPSGPTNGAPLNLCSEKGDTGKQGGKRTQATATLANPNKAAKPAHNPTPRGDEHQKQKAEQHKTRNATPNSKRREKKQNKKQTQKEKQKKANQPPINIGEARWALSDTMFCQVV